MKPIWLKVAETPIRREHYERAVERCLKSGRVDSGQAVEVLEEEAARRLGVPRSWAMAVQSCTAGMGICFEYLGAGRRVVAPAITWPGSYCMAQDRPLFYDMKPPARTSDLLVLVDLFGEGKVYEDIERYWEKDEGRPDIVLDAAHNVLDPRHGELLKKLRVAAVVYSFGAVKQLSGIRGGMIVSPQVSDRWRAFRHYGVLRDRLAEQRRGGNYDMNEFSAELILAQYETFVDTERHAWALMDRYIKRLRPLKAHGVKILERGSGHLFVIWTEQRDRLRDALRFEGIETSVHYKLPTWLDPFAFPRSRNHANTALTLPLHSRMGIADCDAVCEVVLRELGGLTPNEGQSKPKL